MMDTIAIVINPLPQDYPAEKQPAAPKTINMLEFLKKLFTRKPKPKNPWKNRWRTDHAGNFIEGDIKAFVKHQQSETYKKLTR